MQDSLAKHRIVLLGIGHTNAHILKMWRMHALPNAELFCVSNFRKATYSGMLPGVLSGQYRPQQMAIDLVKLCAAAEATLVIGNVDGLDLAHQRLTFTDHGSVEFDVLSVGIGSRPTFNNVSGDLERVVAIKPMQTFLPRLEQRLLAAASNQSTHQLRIIVVGGGAGGAEIAMCLPGHLATVVPEMPFELSVVQAQPRLLPGLLPGTAARVERTLKRRGVQIILGQSAVEVRADALVLADGTSLPADLVIWATGAIASPLLAKFGLPIDDRGFLRTRDTLQSTADVPVFAVGDSGTIEHLRLPKAGVYAVRQGPVLWRNLTRMLRQQPLQVYRPQSGFLKLLNQGDGRAIGEYLGCSFEGGWAWKWKDHIDRKFMAMYQNYIPAMRTHGDDASQPAMRCAGCGGKIGGNVLGAVLGALDVPTRPEVVIGLAQPDDAAVLELGGKTTVTMTTDFFQAPLRDAYLTGRIAALNALSDVWAMGADPMAALANVVLPVGPAAAQKRLLRELLEGSLEELRRAGTTLAGGHTIEGPALVIGFSILADQTQTAPTTKSNLQAGDLLLLSKPLGSGILLAAHMQAACGATWMKALTRTLLQSNQATAALAIECGATALTDVTGFGLAGHLLEMLRASQVSAEIELKSLQLLSGVAESLQANIESTLAPDNRAAAEPMISVDESLRETAGYRVLFDPQTNGGILFGLRPETYAQRQEQLERHGIQAIGTVKSRIDTAVNTSAPNRHPEGILAISRW